MLDTDLKCYIDDLKINWKPNPVMSLTDWCEKHVSLHHGKFQSRPYQRGILDAMLDGDVFILKSSRIGFTQLMTNAIFYYTITEGLPSRNLLIFPTISDCDGFSKNELSQIAADSNKPEYFSSDTVRFKSSPGSSLYIIGSQSESSLRRLSVDNVFFDEISAYKKNSNVQGDVFLLGKKRAESSQRRRLIAGSSPAQVGECRMSELFDEGNQQYFNAPCLSCSHMHPLTWDQFINCDDETLDVYHVCPNCGFEMDHHSKFRWMEQDSAQWIAKKAENKTASFFIWSAYSYDRNARWNDIREAYLLSKKSEDYRETFENTFLGQPFEPKYVQLDYLEFIQTRVDNRLPGIIPGDVVCLYAGVDVQRSYFAITIIGWDKTGRYHVIDHINIEHGGDVFNVNTWDYLKEVIYSPFYYDDGRSLSIRRVGLDSGYATQQCYDFQRIHRKKVSCIKGSGIVDKDIESKVSRVKLGHNRFQEVYIIGTHKLKIETIAGFQNEYSSNFPALEQSYFQGLLSERLITQSNGKVRWTKMQKYNEPFDCVLYALFISRVDQVRKRLGL